MKKVLKALFSVILVITMILPNIVVFASIGVPYQKTGIVYTVNHQSYYQAKTTSEYNGVVSGTTFWLDENDNIVTDMQTLNKLERMIVFRELVEVTDIYQNLENVISVSNTMCDTYIDIVNNDKACDIAGMIIGEAADITSKVITGPVSWASIALDIMADGALISTSDTATIAVIEMFQVYVNNAIYYASEGLKYKNVEITDYDDMMYIVDCYAKSIASRQAAWDVCGDEITEIAEMSWLEFAMSNFWNIFQSVAFSVIPDEILSAVIASAATDGILGFIYVVENLDVENSYKSVYKQNYNSLGLVEMDTTQAVTTAANLAKEITTSEVTGSEVESYMRTVYAKALSNYSSNSFNGYCGDCVAYQLKPIGITTSVVSHNGNDAYAYYAKMSKTSGGYTVNKYPSATTSLRSALNVLDNAPGYTFAVLGFDTGSSSADGQKYGHTLLIYAVVDGYVYYTECFNIGSTGIPFGKRTISSFCSAYSDNSSTSVVEYRYDGMTWFTKDDFSVDDGTQTPLETANIPEGIYVINSLVNSYRYLTAKTDKNYGQVEGKPADSTDSQKFEIVKYQNDYVIISKNSTTGRVVNVERDGICQNGDNVILWDKTQNGTQIWKIYKDQDGYSIRPQNNTSLALTTLDTGRVVVNTYTGASNQIWKFSYVDDSAQWSDWSEWTTAKPTESDIVQIESKTQYGYYHYILQYSGGNCGAYPIDATAFNKIFPSYPTTQIAYHTKYFDSQLSKVDTLTYNGISYACYPNSCCPDSYDYDNGSNASYFYDLGTRVIYRSRTKIPETISVTNIGLNKTSLSLEVGDTETLTATISPSNATNKDIIWTSSSPTVATVANGVVTAVGIGTATITVTTVDGEKTATCAVGVNIKKNYIEGTSIWWTLDGGVLTVGGEGDIPDYVRNTNNAPWYSLRDTITSIVVEDGITSIGNYAFYNLANSTSISVSDSVKRVGIQFIRQTGITEISLPGVEVIAGNAFGRAISLTKIVLSEKVHDIQGDMFYSETLTVVAPEGSYVGYYLDMYTEVFGTKSTPTFEAKGEATRKILDFKKVGQSAFYTLYENAADNWTLEYSGSGKMTNFAYYSDKNVARGLAFSPARVLFNDNKKCQYITKAILGDALTNLGNYALEMCTKVKAVELGDSMIRIGRDAFRSVAIKSLVIPEGVVLIDNQAFANCNALESLTLPSTIPATDPNTMAENKTGLGRDLFLKAKPANTAGNSIQLVVTTANKNAIDYIVGKYPLVAEYSGFAK